MAKNGLFVFFGPAGGGKSYAAAKTFPDSLAILTAGDNLHFYEQWLESPAGKASGRRLPKRIVVIGRSGVKDSWTPGKILFQTLGPDGLPVPMSRKWALETIVTQAVKRTLLEAAQGKPLTYRNFIIDEATKLWSNVFAEIAAVTFNKDGTKLDGIGAYNVAGKWSQDITDFMREVTANGANICMVAHDREPDPVKDKQGGAAFFSQQVMKQITQDASGAILRTVEDQAVEVAAGKDGSLDLMALAAAAQAAKTRPPKRTWRVHASTLWECKLRGLPDEMFDQIRDMEPEQFLKLAGYDTGL